MNKRTGTEGQPSVPVFFCIRSLKQNCRLKSGFRVVLCLVSACYSAREMRIKGEAIVLPANIVSVQHSAPICSSAEVPA